MTCSHIVHCILVCILLNYYLRVISDTPQAKVIELFRIYCNKNIIAWVMRSVVNPYRSVTY